MCHEKWGGLIKNSLKWTIGYENYVWACLYFRKDKLGETAAADERTSSVERWADDELVVVEIKFSRCYLFVTFDRLEYHSYFFNISCSPLDTPLTRVSSGSFSSIATWLPPTSFPHLTESPSPFGGPHKKLYSQQTLHRLGKGSPMHSQTSPR